MRIPRNHMIRRQMMNKAATAITEAMDMITIEVGELYYSEWIKVLQDAQTRLINEMVVRDWEEDDEAD